MKIFRSDEEAVSPVIGVILMVAIVVILAAVIAAFVFGMAGSAGTSKNVGSTVTLNGSNAIDILWQGGSDINSLRNITATLNGGDPHTVAGPFVVGMITPITFGNTTSGGRVIIIGMFTDGSDQVLFDRRY